MADERKAALAEELAEFAVETVLHDQREATGIGFARRIGSARRIARLPDESVRSEPPILPDSALLTHLRQLLHRAADRSHRRKPSQRYHLERIVSSGARVALIAWRMGD
jgi:hypothetical protein